MRRAGAEKNNEDAGRQDAGATCGDTWENDGTDTGADAGGGAVVWSGVSADCDTAV